MVIDTKISTPLPYHTRVSLEAVNILRHFCKPRHEEQHELIAKYENRLCFEINNLSEKVYSSSEGEDIYEE